MEMLHTLLGSYTYHFILLATPQPSIIFAALLFAQGMPKRRHFALRLLLDLGALLVALFGLAVLRTHFENIYTRLFSYVLLNFALIPLLAFCYRESMPNILLNWCAAVAADDIANRVFTLLIMALGKNHWETISLFADKNDLRDWAIYMGFRFLVCFILWLLFCKARHIDSDKRGMRSITILSVVFTVWMVLIQSFSREYMRESASLYAILMVAITSFSFVVLLLRTGILSASRYRQEIAMMEKLLSEERKQYDSVKENIEIVNMRCHDLKHQIDDLSYKLTEGELLQLQTALKIYDSSIKTGNEVLDVVLYEKQLVFDKENIGFTCMANGSLLHFMRTTHIYALFNNALGNALEAVRKLDDPQKKIIDLSVQKENDLLLITVTNYFDGNYTGETTKEQKTRHGLGIRSMRYIAEQYGGTIVISIRKDLFELGCKIPLPKV